VPTRLTRGELRELLLSTGVELLLSDGLRVGTDHITLARVFEQVRRTTGRRITRGSVYERIWPSQEDFQADVIRAAIERTTLVSQETRSVVRAILMDADRTTAEGRWVALHRICATAVELHMQEAARAPHYRVILGAASAISSRPVDRTEADDPPDELQRALAAYLERETLVHLYLYHAIGYYLGFRMRQPAELRHLVLAIGAFADGISMRRRFFHDYDVPVRAQDGAGGTTELSLTSMGVAALADALLELDPDWTAERSLAAWDHLLTNPII
jgi:hypothetical protein